MLTARVTVPGLNAADTTPLEPMGGKRVANGLAGVVACGLAGILAARVPGLEASSHGMAAPAARTAPASAITRVRRRGCRAGSPSPGPSPGQAPDRKSTRLNST